MVKRKCTALIPEYLVFFSIRHQENWVSKFSDDPNCKYIIATVEIYLKNSRIVSEPDSFTY